MKIRSKKKNGLMHKLFFNSHRNGIVKTLSPAQECNTMQYLVNKHVMLTRETSI